MSIIQETAEEYHARKAVSAGFCWEMLPPDGCPAKAYARSVFTPDPLPPTQAREFDVGTAAHLAVLESHDFAARCSLIAYPDYRTREARELRDECYAAGTTPLLKADYELIGKLRKALEESAAAEYFFGEGQSEVSYTWETDGIACKARADRMLTSPAALLVDLKTAASASPAAFQRAMVRDGHHLRAAWYSDGWRHATGDTIDYLFVVVAKSAPHLVEVNRIGERSLEWGRMLYQQALRTFRRCHEADHWPGYSQEGEVNYVDLPVFAERELRTRQLNGEFEEDFSDDDGFDIPF